MFPNNASVVSVSQAWITALMELLRLAANTWTTGTRMQQRRVSDPVNKINISLHLIYEFLLVRGELI